MACFKFNKAQEETLPSAMTDGFIYFCTDSGNMYIDYTNEQGVLERKSVSGGAVGAGDSEYELKEFPPDFIRTQGGGVSLLFKEDLAKYLPAWVIFDIKGLSNINGSSIISGDNGELCDVFYANKAAEYWDATVPIVGIGAWHHFHLADYDTDTNKAYISETIQETLRTGMNLDFGDKGTFRSFLSLNNPNYDDFATTENTEAHFYLLRQKGGVSTGSGSSDSSSSVIIVHDAGTTVLSLEHSGCLFVCDKGESHDGAYACFNIPTDEEANFQIGSEIKFFCHDRPIAFNFGSVGMGPDAGVTAVWANQGGGFESTTNSYLPTLLPGGYTTLKKIAENSWIFIGTEMQSDYF